MAQSNLTPKSTSSNSLLLALAGVLLGVVAGFGLLAIVLLVRTPLGSLGGQLVDGLFALSSVQALWYVTRAAGLVAYLLLWLATVWGLAVSGKTFDPLLARVFTFDFHQFLSLLSIGFIVLHVAVLMADRYLPFTLAEVLVPFVAPYRPVWVGVGIIAMYLTLLVTVTFYIRRWIGTKTFRLIHLASYLAWLGAAVHGVTAGTDSVLAATQLMYAGTSLAIVFLTVYRVVMAVWGKGQTAKAQAAGRASGARMRDLA